MGIILLFLAKPLDKHGITLMHMTYPPLDVATETEISFLVELRLYVNYSDGK